MPPIAPLIFIVLIFARWFGRGLLTDDAPRASASSGHVDVDSWAATVAVARTCVGAWCGAMAVGGSGAGYAAAALALLFPGWIVVEPIVWLGWPRGAYWATLLVAPWSAIADPRSVGVWAAARAARGQRAPAVGWMSLALLARRPRLTGWTLLATGLVADLGGDRARARALLRQATRVPRGPSARRRPARYARAWLAADAGERGDALALLAIREPGADGLDLADLYAQGRAAAVGATVPPASASFVVGVLAGDPWRPWRWRRAGPAVAPPPAPALDPDPLVAALQRLARLGATPSWAIRAPEVEALAVAWAAVPVDALTARIGRRAAVLEVRAEPEALRRALVDAVRPEIVAVIRRMGQRLPRPLVEGVVEEARSQVVREQSAIVEALAEAVVQAERPYESGWEEWDALERAWERMWILATPRERTLVLGEIWAPLCDRAAHLVNVRRQFLLGHVIFRWLVEWCGEHGIGDARLLKANRDLTA